MLSAPATIPATKALTLAPALAALVGQHTQPAFSGQGRHRDQPGARHQIRVIKDRRRHGPDVR